MKQAQLRDKVSWHGDNGGYGDKVVHDDGGSDDGVCKESERGEGRNGARVRLWDRQGAYLAKPGDCSTARCLPSPGSIALGRVRCRQQGEDDDDLRWWAGLCTMHLGLKCTVAPFLFFFSVFISSFCFLFNLYSK